MNKWFFFEFQFKINDLPQSSGGFGRREEQLNIARFEQQSVITPNTLQFFIFFNMFSLNLFVVVAAICIYVFFFQTKIDKWYLVAINFDFVEIVCNCANHCERMVLTKTSPIKSTRFTQSYFF